MSYNNSTYIGDQKTSDAALILILLPDTKKEKKRKIHVRWLGHAH
jgi:hypothetical protein